MNGLMIAHIEDDDNDDDDDYMSSGRPRTLRNHSCRYK
jgi:hypothetical protein